MLVGGDLASEHSIGPQFSLSQREEGVLIAGWHQFSTCCVCATRVLCKQNVLENVISPTSSFGETKAQGDSVIYPKGRK